MGREDESGAAAIESPLPQRRVLQEAGIGGSIKQRPEDFLVDELPLYEPAGEGEHLYVRIEKKGVSHGEMMSHLRRHFRVGNESIGFAGMKDKVGVTRQTISIHTSTDPAPIELSHAGLRVLWVARHRNKLRKGHLAGNRFSIRIRDVNPLRVPSVASGLQVLTERGAPNYFGPQRLGYRKNNHVMGLALMQGAWQAMLDELLGTGGSIFPEYQRERRELYDRGAFEAALEQWTAADPAECMAMRALTRGATPAAAVRAIDRSQRGFFISAWQSAIFNRVLDERVGAGTFDALEPGDLAWNHGARNVFAITDVADDAELEQRMKIIEISPSGPLWGMKMQRAGGEVDARERAALQATGMTEEQLARTRDAPRGGRRPLRVPVGHPEVEGGVDEYGGYVRLAFDLPAGAYATIVLRELMGDQ